MHFKIRIKEIVGICTLWVISLMSFAQGSIEEKIRQFNYVAKEENISIVRNRIATHLMNKEMVAAQLLTDSMKKNFQTRQKRAFRLYENFALEMALGRPDSALAGFSNEQFERENFQEQFFPFNRDDFFAKSLLAIFSLSMADSSYQTNPNLRPEEKELIRLIREAYRFSQKQDMRQLSMFELGQYLNVNGHHFLARFPKNEYSKYAQNFTKSVCFVSNEGFTFHMGGGMIFPSGQLNKHLNSGGEILFSLGWDTRKIRYRIGFQVNLMTTKHPTFFSADTLPDGKTFQHIQGVLNPQFKILETGKFSHWLSPQVCFGSSNMIKRSSSGNEKADFIQLGSAYNWSLGYEISYMTNPGRNVMSPYYGMMQNNTRFIFGLDIRAGYQQIGYLDFSGYYISSRLTFGLMLGRLTNKPNDSELNKLRW